MRSPEHLTDAALLERTRTDARAFAAFYDRYESPIVGYFMRRTQDREVAADLTAEVFAAALAAAARYRPGGPTAAAWLFTIAQNTLSKSVRRGRVEERARRRLGMTRSLEFSDATLESIDATLASNAWVTELLDRLPPDQRDAVRAHVLDDRSYDEIAGQLQTSALVIRKRVSRGLAQLRQGLKDPS